MTVRSVRPAVVRGKIRAPPSKSYTHRALLAAYLSHRPCEVVRPLTSEDTRATQDGLRVLGARIGQTAHGWSIRPEEPERSRRRLVVDCRESGTSLRFLAAAAALEPRRIRLNGSPGLARRPSEPLYSALRSLGADVVTPSTGSSVPCTVCGPMEAGPVRLPGDVSSQFVSALLLVLPCLADESRLRLVGPVVSRPYIDATIATLAARGIRVVSDGREFRIPGGQAYAPGRISVPGDASSAAYLWAAAAATGGKVAVAGLTDALPQADLAILSVLRSMGATVGPADGAIAVEGPLSGPITCDLTDSPDLFPLVAALAALVPGRTSRLCGASHVAFKESDRRTESARLATAMGARVRVSRDAFEVEGADKPKALDVPELGDHRLVMAAAVAALALPEPSRIGRAEAARKSYPDFWRDLSQLTEGAVAAP